VFQLGIVFNFSDEPKKMQPDEKITFGKLDFIADRFGDLRLQEPERTEREEERSLQMMMIRVHQIIFLGFIFF
jgi:hypothetical protein